MGMAGLMVKRKGSRWADLVPTVSRSPWDLRVLIYKMRLVIPPLCFR